MEFKGTKGNWSLKEGLIYRRPWQELYEYGGGVGGEQPIASIMGQSGTFFTKEEVEANAKLISAAPELLEALKELLNVDELDVHAKFQAEQKAFQVIKKATS